MSKRKQLLLAFVIILFILAILLTVVSVINKASNNPATVGRHFAEQIVAQNPDESYKLTSQTFRGATTIGQWRSFVYTAAPAYKNAPVQDTNASHNPTKNSAQETFLVQTSTTKYLMTMSLSKQGGSWLVDTFTASRQR